jgi:N-terminal domain of anti-restriction factor ArdC/IrrE N-terminal-like domain
MEETDRRSELLAQLTEGISSLTTSEVWLRHLDWQSRFHRYSFGNVVLIAAQCPEASYVAGFHAWRRRGRSVRRGEKAIWILAPMAVRRAAKDESEDARVIRGFKHVPVFDVSQTEGDELPATCHKLCGDPPPRCFAGLCRVAGSIGYTVEPTSLPEGLNGDCQFTLRRIRVEARNSPAQQVKTLAHEIAHAILHQGHPDRRLAELEAESTAYVVCQCLGLDTGAYTFGYVATWAGGGEQAVAGIKASGTHIQEAAAMILSLLGEDESEGVLEAAA